MRRLMNLTPGAGGRLLLGLLPFMLLLLVYLAASADRLAENPNDKLLPSMAQFAEAIRRNAIEPNVRTGEVVFWVDTEASLKRLGIAVAASAAIALFIGLANGLLPLVRAGLSPLITAISLIPPMAILPVLFIVFGLGELSKGVLIALGITPFLIRDLQARALELPEEMLIKAQTLGASTWLVALRVMLPQLLPRLIDAVRLSLGAAWLFLIAAEAVAATEGLGYRIFLVRRYLSMDLILPYVVWITLLAWLVDWLLARLSRLAFPWYQADSKGGH
ncbi:MAG: ABC transporter permease subunit [Gammaproteobacteria bacterium]|nr:ABC transporter permease subunit [Gammaproteobacteria bacterium]